MGTVRYYLDLLPRLRAEEAMDDATRMAMGAATLKPDARREVMHDWQDTARDPNAPPPVPKARPLAMFGSGVAIVMEPPRRPKESVEAHGE